MGWKSEERREFVRVSYPCEITLVDRESQAISTQTENISAGGIRIFSKERLVPNSFVNIEIHLKDKKTISCKARIVWAFARTDISGKDHLIHDTGIEFIDIKSEDIETLEKLVVDIASGKA